MFKSIFNQRWSQLNSFGKSKILNSSYFWLFFVPIAAKLLVKVDDISIDLFYSKLEICLELPFSWKLFYFSSICFSVASFIYNLKCPKLIKEFNDFNQYGITGRSGIQLKEFIFQIIKDENEIDNYLKYLNEKTDVRNSFWNLREKADFMHSNYRKICALLYFSGFILFFIILCQNLLYVISASFK
ncbi:hypothetical protein QUF90_02855 [Desulfococcaceae bacterium HSG9]|nr:hypothetical protein [Desulfococcaceae bacterium HSG9]